MPTALVICATCGRQLEVAEADVVDFGTGYLCEKCRVAGEVDAHLHEADEHDKQRRQSRDGLGYYAFEPSARQVRAEVDAIRARPPQPGDDRVPSPAQIDPTIQSDDDTASETLATMGKGRIGASETAIAPPPPSAPRYLCIVCFRETADEPRACPRDRVPLANLADDEALAELRAHVRALANRREGRRFFAILVASLVTTASLCLLAGWSIDRRGPASWIALALFVLLWLVSRAVLRPIRARNRAPELLAASGLLPQSRPRQN